MKRVSVLMGINNCAQCVKRKEVYDAIEGYTVADDLIREKDYHFWIKLY